MDKRILTLIKKDILLADYYIFLGALVLFVFPILANNTIGDAMGPVYCLFLGISFCAFLLFGQIFLMESKYQGMTYLLVCPYTREQIALSRYILLAIICVFGICEYKIAEFIDPLNNMQKISAQQIVIAISIVFVSYAVLMPLLFYYPYEKTKIAFSVVSIIIPLWGTIITIRVLEFFGIDIKVFALPHLGVLTVIVIDIILFSSSIFFSQYLLRKKEF